MNPKIYPGLRVQTLSGEIDTDHKGAERRTPAGAWGHVTSHNHADHWNLSFPNGAWVVITEAELRDAAQYRFGKPKTLEQTTLALQYAQNEMGLTILDDQCILFMQDVAGEPQRILDLIKELRDLKEDAQDMLETVRCAWNRWDRLDQEDNPSLGDALERIAGKKHPWESLEAAPEQEAAQATS